MTADPRPALAQALDQVQRQVDAVGADDLSRPTPCADFDVRTLLAHLIAVLRKLVVVGRGGDMAGVPDPAVEPIDRWDEAIRQARAELDQVWSADASLDRDFALPWGTMTGRDLLDAYIYEFTAHTGDLARVTGRLDELDPTLAEAALDWYARNVPADSRPEGGPFAPAIPVADDADAYARLAGYLGRAVH